MALSSPGQGTEADGLQANMTRDSCKPSLSTAAQHQGTHEEVQRGQRSTERSWEGILVKRSLEQGGVHTRDKARMGPSL